MKEINIKENMPPCDVAISQMLQEIELNKKFGDNIICIVHGYGSSGLGGSIKIEVRKTLQTLKRDKKIYDYIAGESFTTLTVMNKNYPKELKEQLLIDLNINNINKGTTIIIIKAK